MEENAGKCRIILQRGGLFVEETWASFENRSGAASELGGPAQRQQFTQNMYDNKARRLYIQGFFNFRNRFVVIRPQTGAGDHYWCLIPFPF